jgi:hypothetical protein
MFGQEEGEGQTDGSDDKIGWPCVNGILNECWPRFGLTGATSNAALKF